MKMKVEHPVIAINATVDEQVPLGKYKITKCYKKLFGSSVDGVL